MRGSPCRVFGFTDRCRSTCPQSRERGGCPLLSKGWPRTGRRRLRSSCARALLRIRPAIRRALFPPYSPHPVGGSRSLHEAGAIDTTARMRGLPRHSRGAAPLTHLPTLVGSLIRRISGRATGDRSTVTGLSCASVKTRPGERTHVRTGSICRRLGEYANATTLALDSPSSRTVVPALAVVSRRRSWP
jgi:hypothetical protein